MQPFQLSRSLKGRLAAFAVAAAATTAGVGMLTLRAAPTAEESAAITHAKDLSNAFRSISDSVLPSVVMITNKPANVMPTGHPGQDSPETPFDDFFRNPEFKRFFKDMPSIPKMPHGRQGGIGSGVIIDESGVILTNNHVVSGGGTVTVRLHDGREFTAEEVKTDPKTDLAVVRIKADNLQAAKLGDSDKSEIGDWVLALGQPFGLEGTVTAGIISAKGRGIGLNDRESYLQTDAAINPGNSGGPLVNLNGEVIGINTAISSSTGGNQGIGFAVPVNMAKWVSTQLIHDGSVHRAQLGVSIQSLTQGLAEKFGLKAREGVLVNSVVPGSPAEAAGMKTGDVIVEYAGKAITDPRELQLAVEQSEAGSDQKLTVVRDGQRMTLTAKVRQAEATEETASNSPGEYKIDNYGFEVGPFTAESAEKMNMKDVEGVMITSVAEGSRADEAGLKSGMVVMEINRTAVKSVEEFRKAMEQDSNGKGTLLLVRTAEGSRFVVLPPKA